MGKGRELMKYCNKSREELAEDLLKLRKRVEELESSAGEEQPLAGLGRHLDPTRLWQSTFDVVDDLMYIIDREFNVVRANKATHKYLHSDEVLGKKCFNFFHQSDNPASDCPACKVFHSGQPCHIEQQENRFDDKWFSISAYPVKDDFGFVWQCLLIYRDITDCKKMMEKMNELEVKDPLTGLINRLHFIEVLSREFLLAARRSSGLVLLILNVNQFKDINYSCGREFGDMVLREISVLLHDRVRNTDICARIGVDEFAVLLPDADSVEGEMIADNIYSIISGFVFEDGIQGRQISISMALAANSEESVTTHDEFLALVNKKLHEVKQANTGRITPLYEIPEEAEEGVFTQ